MALRIDTPWHKRSFDRFLRESLPRLLGERLPLDGYAATSTGSNTCRVEIALRSGTNGDIDLTYENLPQPDEEGRLSIDDAPYVVVPTAAHERLDQAEIRCVGEQLYAYVESRLGTAPADLTWDAELARAWLPLDAWFAGFLQESARSLESLNWLSVRTHLRRLWVQELPENVVAPGQEKVVCLLGSPEGPNMGRLFTIAVGTEVRNGRLVVTDDRPEARLGITASMLPFIEHDDANRSLMGANNMCLALVPADPEPALVQTGNEPEDVPSFWTGRNLLTAFISWGADTCDEGIVISESCARRLDYPYPAEPGDWLTNRHGTTGAVSRVLPDDEMPHLPDGTPVELTYSFVGRSVRMNIGLVLEALAGRVARASGQPAIVPPYHAPSAAEWNERLVRAGLPEWGMERLRKGKDGPEMERLSMVGPVYWNRHDLLARNMIRFSAREERQRMGSMECRALREVGAYENLREALNTRAGRSPQASTLVERVASGPVTQSKAPTPAFVDLARRLCIAGIEATLQEEKLSFRFAAPVGETLQLARPVPHPWISGRQIAEIGGYGAAALRDPGPAWTIRPRPPSAAETYEALVEANDRLARMLCSQMPERLVQDATTQLQTRVRAFFKALLGRIHLRAGERQLFSGRSVLAPGADLRLDQIALPEEMAWALYGPLAARELGDWQAVEARDERASQALNRVMARSWVVLNRAPTFSPTALLAFRPRREPSSAIRIPILACRLLGADFDGDNAAIYLPVTEAAQKEAGAKLSVAGHLARDPSLIRELLPPPEGLWGLASLGLREGGLDEIERVAGVPIAAPNGVINEDTLAGAMRQVLTDKGVDAAMEVVQQLTGLGLEETRASGASISPAIGQGLDLPVPPEGEEDEAWETYKAELDELLLSSTDYQNAHIGPQLLAIKVRSAGRTHLRALIGPWGPYRDIYGERMIVRHSLIEGFAPHEMTAYMAASRTKLARVWQRWEEIGREIESRPSALSTVLARARRSERPGIVFARAAANGEVDPLTDVESRLWVGLPVGE